ncbi:MAG: glucan biosynthesis protein, partial [Mailhella sp.]
MFHRMITLFCMLAVLFAFPLSAAAAAPFTFADVQARAQDLAGTKYVPVAPVPDYLTKLNYASWSSIRCLPEKALWAEEALPFTVQFFHPGLYYDRPVQIHVVNNNDIEDIAFDTSFFQYGSKDIAEQVAREDHMNFAGFRLHYPLNRSDYKDEVAIFLGASYFRALAAGTHYG